MRLWSDANRGYLRGLLAGDRRLEGVRVFFYHGVVERKKDPLLERNFSLLTEFQSHLRFLRRFRVLSLRELADELSSTGTTINRAAVITVDDGFANSVVIGEIANVLRLPWSLFISTGAVGRENSLWPIELALLVLHGHAEQVEVFDGLWRMNSSDEREVGFRSILAAMKGLPSNSRRLTMDCIRQQFPKSETHRLLYEFPSVQMLSWEQARQLASAGVEIASHGVDHEIHHMDQTAETRWHELTESKIQLTKRLHRPCAFFAFPNGDFTPSSAGEVQRAGYELGFTTQPKSIMHGANPFILPRLYPAGPLHQLARDFFWQTR